MKYPQQQTANRLAQHGRYGDDTLVHMSRDEVAGIASLAPNGQLPINPVTGQPEAFGMKDMLRYGLPIAASIAMPALLPALPAAMAGGIGSGLATAAITGDLERGLVSGVMGAGIGAAAGAAGTSAAEAAAASAVEGTATGAGAMAQEAIGSSVLGEIPNAATQAISTPALSMAPAPGLASPGLLPNPAAMTGAAAATPPPSLGMAAPFKEGSGFASELMKPRTMLPAAMGYGQLAQMDADDAYAKGAGDLEEEREAKRKQAYDDLQAAYRGAQPGAMTGMNPYRGSMSQNMPPPMYGYAGGRVGYSMGGRTVTRSRPSNGRDRDERDYSDEDVSAYGGIDPVTIQLGLRGRHSVAPPPGFMPGFNPEFNYFQDDPQNIKAPPPTTPQDWSKMYAGMPSSRVQPGGGSYFENILPKPEDKPEGMAVGGDVNLNTQAGQVPVAPGGIAGIDNQYTQGPAEPTGEDIQMLAQALLGGSPQADQIIEMFVGKYGPEVFQKVRQMILQSSNPGAQTEGMVQGQGGGMDDQVPGMIGDQQPVAVSPGEYIVPADVVSGLGDGSSDSGASELDSMADNVRMARQGGRIEQPNPLDARKYMPG